MTTKKTLIPYYTMIYVCCHNFFGNPGYQCIGILPGGAGAIISEQNETNFDFDLNLGLLGAEDSLSGFGIEWIPINYKYTINNHWISLINAKAYWNIFNLIPVENLFVRGSVFGPFVSINYAPNFNFTNWIFCAGARYSFTGLGEGIYRLPILHLEGGYKNINEKNYYYCSVQIEIFWAALIAVDKLKNIFK
jgi:hypothetical protein